jgi:hypothetical protein
VLLWDFPDANRKIVMAVVVLFGSLLPKVFSVVGGDDVDVAVHMTAMIGANGLLDSVGKKDSAV